AVAETQQTIVDNTRETPQWGANPPSPSRTLATTILYPKAAGSSSKPYPIVMFSHGLGASPEIYAPMLRQLAAAGYVVAAPRFPLTNSATPGGPDAGDVVNQPGDISFVLTQILDASAKSTGPLAGLVDPEAVAVVGHSNGAITTLGLAANTCCLEPRAKAAV